jgi:hypothetical protein
LHFETYSSGAPFLPFQKSTVWKVQWRSKKKKKDGKLMIDRIIEKKGHPTFQSLTKYKDNFITIKWVGLKRIARPRLMLWSLLSSIIGSKGNIGYFTKVNQVK